MRWFRIYIGDVICENSNLDLIYHHMVPKRVIDEITSYYHHNAIHLYSTLEDTEYYDFYN